ncbi:MAG: 2-C-methyl-D-erythritol 2,4-cyclodiphosphate synthase [Spirochaetaceae bacterium]|jgi:2-C-methyl-D-erythritol 2,4-cyclodiphosphate synthase|nr:2-C-methyl-D-erythritol 2,4-cyclodiphosphate synthase [Spirochaetaceae bacterium]
MRFRVGIGTDLHRLVTARRFVLGGVCIPAAFGPEGHSDGDALIHAVIDALLGAAALDDIGGLFPPEDAAYKDADSRLLAKEAVRRVRAAGWEIANIDAVVECEAPKILPYREAIRASLAAALGISAAQVFVKGKTGEGLGEIGRGKAVYAQAVCLLTGGAEAAVE